MISVSRFVQLALFAALCSAPATLQAQFWGGCRDNYGRAVPDYPKGDLADVAVATLTASGAPIIYYNPAVLLSVSFSTRRFAYMHECGHHALGQISSGVLIPFASEQAADCWAARSLVGSGTFSRADLRAVQTDMAGTSGDWTHFPGPQRALNLIACLSGGDTPDVQRCRTVTEYQDQVFYEDRIVQQQVPCAHCGYNYYGYWVCAHPFDIVNVRTRVPVTRRVPVPRTVCS